MTTPYRSIIKSQKLFCAFLLLGICINGLRAQDSLTDIIPAGSFITKLSSNQFIFTEGPVWYRDSVLLFTNNEAIICYNPVGNQFHLWPNNSGGCNGLTCDKDGNLLACASSVIELNNAGVVSQTLAAIYNGKPFNNPNDLIADDKGGVYFTDPAYFVIPPQDKEAVYYIDSTGNVTRIIDDLLRPNGIVLSPGCTKLYVVDANTNYVYSWDVAGDGSVSGKSIFAELETTGGPLAGSDGMAIDINGNIYIASEKGIQVFSPQGVAITTIVVPEIPSNCDFGGAYFKTLYITARKNIYSIDLNYPGYAVSRKVSTTGTNSIPDKSFVEIYPNPAGDFLYVRYDHGKVTSLELLNMDGKKESISLKKEEAAGIEINTQDLKSGMYLLRIVYNEGIVTRKFVKK